MGTRKETERTKFIQDKCQSLLTQMLRDEDNKYCVDCDAKGPRWASWNLGVFLCIRCAGIHRNLGVHISRVKSVNLDSWTPEQVVSLQNMGNSRARAVYEAQLPDGFRRPQTDSALESFIRAKYEHKKYMAREWVPTAPIKANWDKEIDEEMERQKRKKKTTSSTLSLNSSSMSLEKKSATTKSPVPAPLPKPQGNSSSPKAARTVTSSVAAPAVITAQTDSSSDLLGLGSPIITSNGAAHNASSTTQANDLGGDVFSSFLSGPPAVTSNTDELANGSTVPVMPAGAAVTAAIPSLAKQEQDFFNQVPSDSGKSKMTKDSILALYGTAPISAASGVAQFNGGGSTSAGGAAFNHFGSSNFVVAPQMSGFGGVPVPQFGQQAVPNMNFIPTQQQQQYGAGVFGATTAAAVGPTGFQHMQSFAQFPAPSAIASAFPTSFGAIVTPTAAATTTAAVPTTNTTTTPNNNANINQQFGSLNLGNVWQ